MAACWKITSPHGVNGKLQVKSLSDFEERFTKPGQRWLQKENENPIPYELISGYQKPGKNLFVITLKEINNRNHAENLRNHKILVKSNDIPKLMKGEFHISELINLKVKQIHGNELKIIGVVCDFSNEKNNLLTIRLFDNEKKVLVPFVKEIVTKVDKANKFLIINPPQGLLEL